MKNRDLMNLDVTGKGYSTNRVTDLDANGNATQNTKIMETLYWVHPVTGNVWKAQEKPASHQFHVRGITWEKVDALPEACKFIGRYHGPLGCN